MNHNISSHSRNMDKFYKYDYGDTSRGGFAAAADPSEIQEGGERYTADY
jgi:hypothetical protein